jgi:glycosyltransferase involved in cell wall biosynthesis
MMPLAPSVGVVVANHNNGAFVERALESVAGQSARDLCVVVIDDASTDRSAGIIERCLDRLNDPRFRFLKQDRNLGQAATLARGLRELDTPFVSFLDSDDIWHEDFVARHLEAHLNADFPVAMTYCDSQVIDRDDRLLAGTAWWFDSSEPGHWSGRDIDTTQVPTLDPRTGELRYPDRPRLRLQPTWSIDGATNTMSSMMFRRAFVDMVLVPPSDTLKLYADYYLATFAGLMTGTIAIHRPLYAYRMHGANSHSNGAVLGGTYNTSTRDWGPIRYAVLQAVQVVLRRDAERLVASFGVQRHAEAEAQMAGAIGVLREPSDRLGRLANMLDVANGVLLQGLNRLGLRRP